MLHTQQIRELRNDLANITNERNAAKGEEKRLRELVEVYGDRNARPLLDRARAVLADLDVREPKIEAEVLRLTIADGAEGAIFGRVQSLTNEFSLTAEQSAKVEQLLRSGKSLKEAQTLARRFETEGKAQAAQSPAFNQPDGVPFADATGPVQTQLGNPAPKPGSGFNTPDGVNW